MSFYEYDIPVHRQAELDRNHAQNNEAFDKALDWLALQGLANLEAPARVLGIHNALKANSKPDDAFMLAALAISRLFEAGHTDPADGLDFS